VLSRETDPPRFHAVAAALAGSSELTATVLEPATRSEDAELRREAAYALSTVPPPPDAGPYRYLLSDADERVRLHAEHALRRWETMRAAAPGR
jgi:HEAT repeat protein